MAGGESVNAWPIVIHKIGKTLNLCIIKTPEGPFLLIIPSKQGFLGMPKNHLKPHGLGTIF